MLEVDYIENTNDKELLYIVGIDKKSCLMISEITLSPP